MGKQDHHTLNHFFIYKLENIYGIQKYLKTELPFMIKAAQTGELKAVLEGHQHIVARQVIRLDAIFSHLSLKPHRRYSSVVKRMIRETKWQIKETRPDPAVLDTCLIIAWRGLDHYNIASYTGLISLSRFLKLNKVAESLFKALEEEMEADSNLRELSGGFYSHAMS